MSGVVGLWHLDGRPVDRAELARMTEALAHRGPDGSGVWLDAALGFGHRMLWTTPESLKEQLPLVSASGNFVITADARIDNREELARTLTFPLSEAIPDSALIVAAYEQWGERCPEKLVGDFAFAIWDRQARTLFAARDRIGIKPFYYHFGEGRILVFASEITPLLIAAGLEKSPNRQAIAEFLCHGDLAHEETLFEGVKRLPPASTLLAKDGRIALKRYWAPASGHSMLKPDLGAHAEEFRELLEQAVKAQMRSAYPIGCLLSGGLDSSSILCLASKLAGDKRALSAFSMVFDQLSCDERPHIQSVVDATGVDWISHTVDAGELDAVKALQACYARQPEWPVQDLPASATLWPLMDEAKARGVRVMLTGVGGDQVASGSTYYLADLLSSFRFGALYRELKHYRFSRQTVRSWMAYPLVPDWVWRARHRFKQLRGQRDASWYLSISDAPAWRKPYTLPRRRFASAAAWHQACYISDSLLSLYLDGWWDPLGSHGQMEFRHPFFDARLIEFLQRLPAEDKLWSGVAKIVLRQGMKGVLPECIRMRDTKAEFSPIVGLALGSMTIDPGRLTLSRLGLVDAARVAALVARQESGPSVLWLTSLWRLIRIEAWYNLFPTQTCHQEVDHVR